MGDTGTDRGAGPVSGRRPAGRSRRAPRLWPLKWVLVGLAVLVALLIGGPYLFFDVIEGSAPPKLQLPAASSKGGAVAPGPVSGTWKVSGGSQAGYRVEEVLFGQHHTAVGRTDKVTGSMLISGTVITAADFTVDLASVKSDQGSRDAQFRGFIMETYAHPNGGFRLTEPIQLGSVPAPGQRVAEQATGDLTLRGVTREVTFSLQAERSAGGVDVSAAIPITFSRWHIPNPSFAVAQLGSTGTIEVLLHLVPA